MRIEDFGTGQGSTARLVELVPGRSYALFYAADDEDLPDPNVPRELRVLARSQLSESRGLLDVLLQDAGSGVAGGAAWGAVTTSATATLAYLRRRFERGGPLDDAEQVITRVTEAAARILGATPEALRDATVVRQHDLSWQVEFTYDGARVQVLIDPTGSMLQWRQTATGPEPRTET